MHELPTIVVTLASDKIKPSELARRLRLDPAALFTRIENDKVVMDMRTVREEQVVLIVAAMGRRCA